MSILWTKTSFFFKTSSPLARGRHFTSITQNTKKLSRILSDLCISLTAANNSVIARFYKTQAAFSCKVCMEVWSRVYALLSLLSSLNLEFEARAGVTTCDKLFSSLDKISSACAYAEAAWSPQCFISPTKSSFPSTLFSRMLMSCFSNEESASKDHSDFHSKGDLRLLINTKWTTIFAEVV